MVIIKWLYFSGNLKGSILKLEREREELRYKQFSFYVGKSLQYNNKVYFINLIDFAIVQIIIP